MNRRGKAAKAEGPGTKKRIVLVISSIIAGIALFVGGILLGFQIFMSNMEVYFLEDTGYVIFKCFWYQGEVFLDELYD